MKDNTRKTLKYYWQSMRNYKLSLVVILVSIIGATVIDSIIPIYFKNFFNLLSENKDKSLMISGLVKLIMFIGIFSLMRWLLWRLAVFILNFFESINMSDLSKICFNHLHKHSYTYFSNNFTGSVVKKSKSFVNAFEVLADQLFFELIPAAVTITVITIVLARVNIYLGLGMLLWNIIFMVINWIFTKYKIKFDIQRSEAETTTSSFLADTVTNNTNIK